MSSDSCLYSPTQPVLADLDFLIYLQWSDGRRVRQMLSDAQHRQYRDGVILLKGMDQHNSHSEIVFFSLEVVLARVAMKARHELVEYKDVILIIVVQCPSERLFNERRYCFICVY